VRAVDRGEEIRQLVLGQRRLDQWEEDTFLVADVCMEPLAELVQLFGWRRRVGGEIGCAAAKVDVFDEHANDRVVLPSRCYVGSGQDSAVIGIAATAASAM
jgi:hypothetical protein